MNDSLVSVMMEGQERGERKKKGWWKEKSFSLIRRKRQLWFKLVNRRINCEKRKSIVPQLRLNTKLWLLGTWLASCCRGCECHFCRLFPVDLGTTEVKDLCPSISRHL